MTDFVKNPLDEENKVLDRGFYSDGDDMRAVRVEEGMVEIAENAFRDCEALEEVYLPRSLTKISACAFAGCKNLKRVYMEYGLVEIGDEAFSGCSSLYTLLITGLGTEIDVATTNG